MYLEEQINTINAAIAAAINPAGQLAVLCEGVAFPLDKNGRQILFSKAAQTEVVISDVPELHVFHINTGSTFKPVKQSRGRQPKTKEVYEVVLIGYGNQPGYVYAVRDVLQTAGGRLNKIMLVPDEINRQYLKMERQPNFGRQLFAILYELDYKPANC